MALFDTRDHVKFPYRFMDFASDLTDAEMGRMVDAIIRYCKNETLPDFTGRCWDVFMWMKRIIDAFVVPQLKPFALYAPTGAFAIKELYSNMAVLKVSKEK